MGFLKRTNVFILLAIVLAALFIGGCVYNVSYLVKNAKMSDVGTVLKDYVGLSGYNMTYADDQTGAYRVVVNSTIVPAGPAGRPVRVVERQVASLAIQLSQEGNDVSINAQSTGEIDASEQFRGFIAFLQGKGYTIQEIRQGS